MVHILSRFWLALIAVCYLFAAEALWSDAKERQIMHDIAVALDREGRAPDLHTHVVRLRDYLVDHYIVAPKSDQQLSAWKATRTFLRQPALATVEGKPALCGELARLAIKVLRAEAIEARRVYLYKNPATNHVVFEYFDSEAKTWRVMDSYASSAYLNSLLAAETLSVDDMLRTADPVKLVYDKYGYLPRGLFFKWGEARARAIPYAVSWWYEEVYLLHAMAFLAMGLMATGMWFLARRIGARNDGDSQAGKGGEHVVKYS